MKEIQCAKVVVIKNVEFQHSTPLKVNSQIMFMKTYHTLLCDSVTSKFKFESTKIFNQSILSMM